MREGFESLNSHMMGGRVGSCKTVDIVAGKNLQDMAVERAGKNCKAVRESDEADKVYFASSCIGFVGVRKLDKNYFAGRAVLKSCSCIDEEVDHIEGSYGEKSQNTDLLHNLY